MESGIKVGDIMTRNYVYTRPDTNLRQCAIILVKKKVGSLIIKEKDKLLGILTEKDIVWAVVKKSKKELKNIKASDIMKRKVHTIKASSDIMEAAKRFKKRKIRRLPVVENGRVIGMLTMKDLVKVEPGLLRMLIESIKIKEETSKMNKAGKNFGGSICEECGEYDILQTDGAQKICETCLEKRGP